MNNQLISGHSLCLGCNAGIIGNEIMQSIDEPVIIVLATGCLEVGTTTYPNSSWPVPTIHVAFGSAPAVASGIIRAKNILIQKLKKDPKLKKLYPEVDMSIKIIVIAGDGATYDIGLGALSAMAERGEDILYICYNNQAYMNTGIQKSGATPIGAENTTQPDWQSIQKLYPKSVVDIMLAQKIPYVAQTISNFKNDLGQKVKKALSIDGPKYIEVLSPCIRGWHYEPKDSMKIINLAVETNFWPLLEYENGQLNLNYQPEKQIPVSEWFKLQKRFSETLKDHKLVKQIQTRIDNDWQNLLKKASN